MQNNKGLTLIELIVVMTIVAILSVIGLPAYQTYMIETRRSDAINAIRADQLIIEEYMQQNGGATPSSSDISLSATSPGGFYNIAYTQVDSSSYSLVATAVSTTSQNNDTGCTTITLISQMDTIFPTYCH